MAGKPMDIRHGDMVTLEVEVINTWDDGRITFRLYGYDSPITIPEDSPNIVGVDPTSPSRQKGKRR